VPTLKPNNPRMNAKIGSEHTRQMPIAANTAPKMPRRIAKKEMIPERKTLLSFRDVINDLVISIKTYAFKAASIFCWNTANGWAPDTNSPLMMNPGVPFIPAA